MEPNGLAEALGLRARVGLAERLDVAEVEGGIGDVGVVVGHLVRAVEVGAWHTRGVAVRPRKALGREYQRILP
ncbi:hypothetical protein GCM10009021_00290 [Halarchaeum nitratireducens]|uniref:Uncharacterized protein n=1 Tax=Halarchaeum nitratireducens TaxID=489913 RepID=A0A830G805_9EURY|nr:hypothetical protein GCM10009021_00290 [Halarchaeum nitratireducens]